MILLPLNSTKLHCFACLARTIELTSRTVRALSFAEQGEYHLVSLTLPCRLITAGRGRVGVSHSAVGRELGGWQKVPRAATHAGRNGSSMCSRQCVFQWRYLHGKGGAFALVGELRLCKLATCHTQRKLVGCM